jgi:hypothetical protein
MADMNGDGRQDIVGFASDGVYVALSSGGAFSGPARWTTAYAPASGWGDYRTYWSIYPRTLADVNGDGLADLVGFASGAVYVSLSNGTGFAAAAVWSGAFVASSGWSNDDSYPRELADVNGDGRADIVGFASDGVYVALSTGTSFGSPSRWSSGFGAGSGWLNNTDYPRMLVDVNGDGLADVVGFASNAVTVALSTGASFAAPAAWSTSFVYTAGWGAPRTHWDIYPRRFADVNGDGKADLVGFASDGVYVALSTGLSFQAPTRWVAEYGPGAGGWSSNNIYPRQLADVNGDGLADIVGFASTGAFVALSKGDSFTWPQNMFASYGTSAGWSNNDTYPRILADVNGDGKADIVGFASPGVQVATAYEPSPDLLVSAANGAGATTAVSYKPLTDASVYQRGTAAVFPVTEMQGPMFVVSAADLPVGPAATRRVTYTYSAARLDQDGRGFLGFQTREAVDVQTGLRDLTVRRQDWPYTHLPSLERRTTDSGQVLSEAASTFACVNPASGSPCAIAPGNRYFPYLSQSLQTGNDLNGATLPAVTTSSQYDVFGNATQVTLSTGDGYSKTTNNVYANDVPSWLLGRLKSSTVQSTVP